MSTFESRWEKFLESSGHAARHFGQADRALAFAFYTYGWIDGTQPILDSVDAKRSELGELLSREPQS